MSADGQKGTAPDGVDTSSSDLILKTGMLENREICWGALQGIVMCGLSRGSQSKGWCRLTGAGWVDAKTTKGGRSAGQ